jgi:hypothetical protein
MSQDNETEIDFTTDAWVATVRQKVNERPEKRRRVTKAKRDGFIHSLNNDNKSLREYLDLVPDGIERAAQKWGITLPEDQRSLLNKKECRGCYPMYLPLKTTAAQEKMKTKKLAGKSDEEKLKYYRELHNVYIAPHSPRFSRNLAAATARNYEQAFRALWNFLAFKGSYDEMIILLPNPPCLDDNVLPSISPSTLKEYIIHRYSEAFSNLHTEGDSTRPKLLDCMGKEMLCEGTTKNYKWFDSVLAAVHYVHKKAKKEERYKAPCPECLRLSGTGPSTAADGLDPCPAHCGNGKTRVHYLRSKGDPTQSLLIEELRKWLEEESKRREYKPNRRSPFLPHDFTTLQQNLVFR